MSPRGEDFRRMHRERRARQLAESGYSTGQAYACGIIVLGSAAIVIVAGFLLMVLTALGILRW